MCMTSVYNSVRNAVDTTCITCHRYDAVTAQEGVREMGGAPRNPAPRNHFLVWIVKP